MWCAVTMLGAVGLGGCAKYAPAEFSVRGHREEFVARSAGSEELRAYADRLAAAGRAEAGPGGKFDASDGLTLAEAEVVALFFNPTLRRVRAEARVPAAGVEGAGRWADPELAVDGARVLEDVDDRWVVGGTMNLTIPISGRTSVLRDARRAEAEAAALGAADRELAVLTDLRREWLEGSAAAERAAALREAIALLGRLAATSDAMAEIGELSPLDARAVRLERALRTSELLSAEAAERESQMRLRAMMGLKPDAEVRLVPTLAVAGPPDEAWKTDDHPRLLQAVASLRAAERAHEAEVRKQVPDLTLGLGYGVDQGESRLLWSGLIPIPVLNANRQAIDESRARRDAAAAQAGETLEQLESELALARLAFESAEARRRQVVDELLPLAARQADDAERLGRSGEAEMLLVLDAVQRRLDARLLVVESARDLAVATARLMAFSATRPVVSRPATTLPSTRQAPNEVNR